MADANANLLSILAGTDPQSPEILQALHNEQARNVVMDSSNWNNTGLAGGIGRGLAAMLMPSAAPQVADITANRIAAQPDEAKLLANPDPYSELANNSTAYSPVARAMVLNGATPTSVADERLKAAQGAMFQAKAAYARQQGEPLPPTYLDGVNSLAAAGQPQAVAPQNGVNPEIATNNFAGMRMPGVPAAGGPAANPSGWQRFATPQDGLAAISHQLDRYANGSTTGQPVNTLRGIVSTWAPANENPTAQLIARASQVTGFDPDQPLNVGDPAVKAKLIEAMIRNEQGGQLPVDPKLIAQVAADPNATAMAVGGAIPPASGSSQAPAQASMPPGVAQLAAAGQPQAPGQPQSTPPMSPGVAQLAQAGQRQINPAFIAAAQRRANTAALLGEQAPQYINEIAGLPFVEPKAQAQASGTAAGELPYAGPKAKAEAEAKLPSQIAADTAKQQAIAERTPTTITINGRELPVTQQQYADIVSRLNIPGIATGAGGPGASGAAASPAGPASPNVTTSPPGMAAGGALPGGAQAAPQPAGAPAAPLNIGKSYFTPEQQKISEAYGDQSAEIVKAAQKAPDVLGKTQVMRTAAQYFTPGATADQRLSGARYFADIAPHIGISVNPEMTKMIASGEAINKEGGQLVAELVRSMGSREAYAVWNQVRTFMPSVSMSDGGYNIILNSIEQGAKRDADLGKFQDQWLGSGHTSIAGMQDAFNKEHPIEAYSSRVMPIPIDFAKGNFVPGAVYVNKAGRAAVRTPDGHWQATE